MTNNEISFGSIKPYSMTELRKEPRFNAEQRRKDEIEAYLMSIDSKIYHAWT